MIIDKKNKILVSSLRKFIGIKATRNIKNVLQKTHSADIAEMLDDLDREEQNIIFNLLSSDQIKSEVLSRLDEPLQKVFVDEIPNKSLIKIISCMDVDDRTDLLGHLDAETSTAILSSMEQKEKEEAEDLLQYPKDCAGGLMTTEILKLGENLTVKAAIESLQKDVEDAEATFYVYIVDENNRLVGVLSLKQLLLSKQTDKLKDIMTKEIIEVSVTTDGQDVARLVERYDFLSLPVVDESFVLLGAITVDDVIDVIREEAKEELLAMGQTDILSGKGYSWLGIAFVVGISFSFWILNVTGQSFANVFDDTSFKSFLSNISVSDLHQRSSVPQTLPISSSLLEELTRKTPIYLKERIAQLEMLIFAIPLLLIMGMTLSNQIVTLTVHDLREGRFDSKGLFFYLLDKVRIGMVVSIVASILIVVLFYVLQMVNARHIAIVTGSLSIHLLLSAILGVLIPWLIRRLQLDPAVGSLSITTSVSQILTLVLVSLIFLKWAIV